MEIKIEVFSAFPEWVRNLLIDPIFRRGLEEGLRARREGRVKPWYQVKRDLGLA